MCKESEKKLVKDIELFEKLQKESIDDIKNLYGLIEQKKGNLVGIVGLLRIDYMILGETAISYKQQYDIAKENFFISSKMQEWFYRMYKDKMYNIDSSEVTTYSYETLYLAVLSGCKEQMIIMANYLGSFDEEEKKECCLTNTLLGYALKYVILDDIVNAMRYINQIEANKSKRGMKQFADGQARAFKGLVQRDEKEFNQGLEFMLKHHVARMKRDGKELEQYCAYDSLALAMLAKERGINITVKHELLPEEYLEETDIDYSAIEVIV